MAMKNTGLRLKEDTLNDLARLAEVDDRDPSYLMRKAVEDYVELRKWQLEEAMKTWEGVQSGEISTRSFDDFISEVCQRRESREK